MCRQARPSGKPGNDLQPSLFTTQILPARLASEFGGASSLYPVEPADAIDVISEITASNKSLAATPMAESTLTV